MILKHGMQHLGLKLYNDCINGDPVLTLTYFTARSNWEKWKTVYFSETIAACYLKVIRCKQLIEFMKLCEYSRSRSFLDHLSRGLIGELIGYPWSSVRMSSTMLKHLLLRNRFPDQSQILC